MGEMRDGEFYFVESVKNGFVPASRRTVYEAIKAHEIDQCPFGNLPEKKGTNKMDSEKMQKVRWVKPRVACEIAFNERTVLGHLCHAKFLRLREQSDLRGTRSKTKRAKR